MKKFLCIVTLSTLAGFGLLTGLAIASDGNTKQATQQGETRLNWLDNSQQALDLAKKENKPILIDFTGSDWCGWCIRLKKEVFNTPEFEAFAKENLILQVADFPRGIQQDAELKTQNMALVQKYGVQGFPTLIILDSEGKQIGQMGYMKGGPKPFINELTKVIKK